MCAYFFWFHEILVWYFSGSTSQVILLFIFPFSFYLFAGARGKKKIGVMFRITVDEITLNMTISSF